MTPKERAIEVVKEYWRAAGKRDHAAGKKVMAENVTRIGPFNDPGDQVTGRDAYSGYIKTIQDKMSSYRTETHDIVATEDGKRVFLQCTEWPGLEGKEHHFPLSIIFDINDDWLIEKIDIYWKNPPGTKNEWVRVDANG